ncbi:hypothetical protein [Silvanigrella aquatica]|uniref:Outer membrane protein beta-barrel domain-containing protein n=1 Tax=Silvanigrella aquatica TaxID=1915309 RepID=A0A1L4D2I5_9BACT|nr:hypothetical protein [Silvanigrella aquatica]APJ04401.1 hypothetical protein AXG55_10980 [Silvanigrella aquatica]
MENSIYQFKNFKLILIVSILSTYQNSYSQEFGSDGNTIKLLLGGGYESMNIQGNNYTGYDAKLKILFPFMGSKDFYIGFGGKYDNVTYTPPSIQSSVTYTHAYDSFQTGLDFGYNLSFSFVDFLINPYLYYSFYDTWLQTTDTSTYQQTYSPYIQHNLNYGIGFNVLFKYHFDSSFGMYYGPSFYYSNAYMIYQNANDSKGNANAGGEGSFNYYSADLTLGLFF